MVSPNGSKTASAGRREGLPLDAEGQHPSRGNLLLLFDDGEQDRVLKVYRRRRSLRRQLFSGLSHKLFEGKRGADPRARCETERLCLDLWAEHGFDVFRRYDEPIPKQYNSLPALWLEYAPGERLFDLLLDPAITDMEKERLVVRLATEDRRRHAKALELTEPLLIHEHSTTKHSIVSGDRLITIDLEGGYRQHYPILEALAQETTGTLRSLWRGEEPCFEERLPLLYLETYGDVDLLKRACERLLSGGIWWRFKRRSDLKRRGGRSKTAVAQQLLKGV